MIIETTTLRKVGDFIKEFFLKNLSKSLPRYQIHYETASGRISHPPPAMPFPKRNHCKVLFIIMLLPKFGIFLLKNVGERGT